MKLTHKAIHEFKRNSRLKSRLALELDCSIYTLARWIKENQPNNDLTKAIALDVIREETGLLDSEILEASDVKEPQS